MDYPKERAATAAERHRKRRAKIKEERAKRRAEEESRKVASGSFHYAKSRDTFNGWTLMERRSFPSDLMKSDTCRLDLLPRSHRFE